MSWMVLRSSGLSPEGINQKFHKSGGIVRTKEEHRPYEGNMKVLFVGKHASSGRREGVVRTKETEIYFFSYRSVVRTTVVVLPDEGASSGRRDPFIWTKGVRQHLKTYEKLYFFGVNRVIPWPCRITRILKRFESLNSHFYLF